jgi:hypothetical protein
LTTVLKKPYTVQHLGHHLFTSVTFAMVRAGNDSLVYGMRLLQGMDDSEASVISPGILSFVCCMIVVATLFCFPFIDRCRRRRIRPDEGEVHDDPEQQERRYKAIESWLVSKRVESHNDPCEEQAVLIGLVSRAATRMIDAGLGSDTSEDEEHECPICIRAYQVGDIVSWSPNKHCDHVFHHSCIKEWLINKTCCPCCRETFLPIDEVKDVPEGKATDSRVVIIGQPPCTAFFFCIQHGLIPLPTNDEECCSLPKNGPNAKGFCSTPDPAELASMRGGQEIAADRNMDAHHSILICTLSTAGE